MATTAVSGASFSADEKRVLFSSNQTRHLQRLLGAGGRRRRRRRSRTSTGDSTYAVSFFPADDRLLYTRDQGGNELNHLYVRETTATEQGPDARARS